jgi:hypothetical protein
MAASTPSPRKKTEKAAQGGEEMITLTEQLDRATASVEGNQQAALKLHSQWRASLLRMSYVVMIVTFHQAQAPTTSCVKEIKVRYCLLFVVSIPTMVLTLFVILYYIILYYIQHWNELKKNSMEETITGWQTITAVLNDSVTELVAIACATFLLWCLSLPMGGESDFSTLPYRLSCACIPMIVSSYYLSKQRPLGCLNDEDSMEQYYTFTAMGAEDPPEPRKPRAFPVVLVFHSIVSVCLLFMQFQVKQHTKNIDMVAKLKNDLMKARSAKKKK